MSDAIVESQTPDTRLCGACTACCDGWLKITIDGETVEPGKKCRYSSGQDCTNYDGRPADPCRTFICGWLARQSPLPDWMRPDKARVILLASYFHWQDMPVDVAVPVATGIERQAFDWLKDFAFAKKRLLLYQIGEDWYAFGPPAFQAEMAERIGKGQQVWSFMRMQTEPIQP